MSLTARTQYTDHVKVFYIGHYMEYAYDHYMTKTCLQVQLWCNGKAFAVPGELWRVFKALSVSVANVSVANRNTPVVISVIPL